MTAVFYILGVFVALVIWSCLSAVSRQGAKAEVKLNGEDKVGASTLRLSQGNATAADRLKVILSTVWASLIYPTWWGLSAVLGGILYLLVWLIF